MDNVTFFSIPKPFIGHNAIIQNNAIQSWLKLVPANQIILIGDEIGIEENANKFGVIRISGIKKTIFGTPILSDAFSKAQNLSKTQLICYLNTDIILFSDFLTAVNAIHKKEFLMVGQRWNLDLDEPIIFDQNWDENLRKHVSIYGKLFSEFGIDYFLFPSGMITKIPDFAVGRPGWDNWLIYLIRKRGICVIDATKEVMVVHQNHDYAHVPKPIIRNTYFGPEAEDNFNLCKSDRFLFTVKDSTHKFHKGRVIINLDSQNIFNRVGHQNVLLENHFYLFLIKGVNYLYKLFMLILTK